LDFLYGDAKLNKLDSNADVYIKKFLADNKGRSYQKEALRKLAWFNLIYDNPSMYKKNMQQILTLKDAPSDEDKSAQKEAQQNYLPNKELLKARILFDGGYFDNALTTMNTVKPALLTDNRSKVEYYYRYARIYHELGEENNAVKFYLLTIQKGQLYDYYFAANSCIKLANIFELQNKKKNAILYYQKAMNLDKDEYNNSINAEAKAGLNRLGA
jgi:tetratricopeptide (TPR) repeat protein